MVVGGTMVGEMMVREDIFSDAIDLMLRAAEVGD